MIDLAKFDCQKCGACCVHAGDVTVASEENLPKHMTRSVRHRMGYASWEADDGVRCMAKDDTGRCRQLAGKLGESVRCKIYDRRPGVCRDYPPGSDSCLRSRRKMEEMQLTKKVD